MTEPDSSIDRSAGGPQTELALTERASVAIEADAVRGTWWTALQAVVGLPLAVIANLIVARSLGPQGYGMLASYITAYSLILSVLNGGINDATIQWSAAAFARGDRVELMQLARRCAGYHIMIEGPLGAIAAFVLLHRESFSTQIGGAVAVAFTMAAGATAATLAAAGRNGSIAKLNLVFGVALQASVVTAAIASHDAGPVWVARLMVGVFLTAGLLLIAPRDIRMAVLTPKLPRGWPIGFAQYSVSTLGVGIIGSLVFSRSELLVLDAYGQPAAAGLFALAAGLAAQITAPIDAMLGPLIPAAAGLVEVGRERAASAVLRGLRLSVLGTAPIALIAVPVIVLVAPLVYGSKFREAGVLFLALGLTSCMQSVLHPVTAFVVALRIPLTMLAVNAVALVFDLVAVLTLAPSIGAAGAVIGNCLGQSISLSACVLLLHRRLGLSLRDCNQALLPFYGISTVVTGASIGGLALQSANFGALPAIGISLAAAIFGGYVVLRTSASGVTNRDVGRIIDSFPRVAAVTAKHLRSIGLIRVQP